MARGVTHASASDLRIASIPSKSMVLTLADRFFRTKMTFNCAAQRRIVVGLIIFATLNALLWSFVRVPGNGGPDEQNHFNVVEQIVGTSELPKFQGYRQGQFSQGPVRAQVAYELTPNFTAIPVAIAINFIGSNEYTFNVHIARLFMVALYPVTLTFAFLTMRRVFPCCFFSPICGVCVMATVPMFMLVHSYYNNDAPAIAAATVATYALVRASQSDFAFYDTVFLGLGLALVALHKYTGFILFPAATILIFWHCYNKPRRLIRNLATTLGIAVLIGSWWYVRNWSLYGDPFGVSYTQDAVDASGGAPIPPRSRGLSLINFATETNWISENFATFWGGYGRERLKLPGAAYLTFAALLITAGIGLVLRIVRAFVTRNENLHIPILAIMSVMHFGLWFVSFWSSYAVDVALHGRYVFPTFTAFSIIILAGLSEVLSRARLPSRLAIVTIPIMLAANGAYFIHAVLPDVNY